MPEYYSDAGSNPGPQAEPAKPEEDAGDSQTAELPKSVLGGKEFKPGEEVVLQIVQVNEDSVIVKYASEDKGKEKEPAETAEAPEMAMGGGGGNPGGGMSSMYE